MSDYSRSTLEPRPCQYFRECRINPDGHHYCTTAKNIYQYRRPDGSIYIRENEAWGHHPNGERDFDIAPLRHPDLTNVGEERAELYKKLYRLRHDQRSIGRFDSVGVTRPIYNPIKPLKPSDLDLPNRSPSSTYSKLLRRVSPLANRSGDIERVNQLVDPLERINIPTPSTFSQRLHAYSTGQEYSVIEATPRISRNVAETEAKRPGEPKFQGGHRFIAEDSPKTEASTGISDLLAIAKEHSRGVERHGQAWIYVAVGLALSLGAIEHEPSLDLVDRALAEILSYEKRRRGARGEGGSTSSSGAFESTNSFIGEPNVKVENLEQGFNGLRLSVDDNGSTGKDAKCVRPSSMSTPRNPEIRFLPNMKGKSRAKKAPIKQEPGLLDPFLSTSNPGSLSRAEIAETIEQDDATVLMQNPGSKEFEPFSWAAGISTHGATEAPKKRGRAHEANKDEPAFKRRNPGRAVKKSE